MGNVTSDRDMAEQMVDNALDAPHRDMMERALEYQKSLESQNERQRQYISELENIKKEYEGKLKMVEPVMHIFDSEAQRMQIWIREPELIHFVKALAAKIFPGNDTEAFDDDVRKAARRKVDEVVEECLYLAYRQPHVIEMRMKDPKPTARR